VVLALHDPRPAPGGCADRGGPRQLQPAPDHQERQARRAVGGGRFWGVAGGTLQAEAVSLD